ncbi:MAG: hypothetical protein K0R93_268 [Anaerosolibacter sp.]|jgi:hypothetical protein|nr:hypothetical protein [Anaerosolibacter sp.]
MYLYDIVRAYSKEEVNLKKDRRVGRLCPTVVILI